MQFLVFGKPEQKLMDNGSSEEVKRLRVEELAKTREYYSKGLLRNIWVSAITRELFAFLKRTPSSN